ncbi:hypothetical protein [Streptomyces sp. NRRL S-350]|uniref:hypothetical protein n=1 Tax=Streptomyces sp. NRRL S-350 TaxID=1463902 RepID=UPI0004BF19FC|nr:hypothetical protein [Streptomyces sp. NRRL S-350]
MAAKFYVSESGTSLMRTGGVLPVPDGWREISEEEYREQQAAAGLEPPVVNLAGVLAGLPAKE